MDLTPNSALWQSENANEILAAYFAAMNQFASSIDGSSVPPDFEAVITQFDFSELHRMTMVRASDAASFENGAAIENIHLMAAVKREYGLRTKGKVEYYADATSDYLNDSNFYSSMKSFWVNMMRGLYEEGKTS